jgi:RimJ/RimL family protein N-acetyltransferase
MKGKISIRQAKISDLDFFFLFQLDTQANYLAAFTPQNPQDKTAYFEKFTNLLDNPTVNMKTILVDKTIVGSIAKFEMEGDAEITYWLDRNFWGRRIATTALKNFLTVENIRPIFGRVAFDNFGSQKVLEKCGFKKIGTDRGFANARVLNFLYCCFLRLFQTTVSGNNQSFVALCFIPKLKKAVCFTFV